MNALIFAAGMGSRLGNITKTKPKALVEVNKKPMLQYAIENVIAAGASCIVINVHHHAQQIIDFVNNINYPKVKIYISDESNELLETGGGILKAKQYFLKDEDIIVHNADVITNASLKKMLSYHKENKVSNNKMLSTLFVKKRSTSRYFLFNDKNTLCGWENTSTNEQIITRQDKELKKLAFSGIHILNYNILNLMGEPRKFSITDAYLNLSAEYDIKGWCDNESYWFDIGTPEKLEAANNFMTKNVLN